MFRKTIHAIGGGKFSWLRELVDNSNDARAKRIDIRVTDTTVTVTDDGGGFTPEGLNAYASLGVSPEGVIERKGKHGTGAKAVFTVASTVRVMTVWEKDEEQVVTFSFTDDELEDALFGGPDILARVGRRTAHNFPRELRSGSVIEFTNFQRGKQPKEESIIAQLGHLLAPWVAENVRVNGRPLQKREIIGQTIKREIKHRVLGLVRVQLFVPIERQPDEELMLGALGPVCSLRSFARELEVGVRQTIPDVYFTGDLCGLIDVAQFNKFSTPGRKEFSSDLYTSDSLALFLNLLNGDLLEDVERSIGMVRKEGDEREVDRLLTAVQQRINRATGYEPGTQVGVGERIERPTLFSISPKDVELGTTETQAFRVRHFHGDPNDLVWEASKSGGEINEKHGLEVIYTAGNREGRFTLVVKSASDPTLSDEATITVVQTLEFSAHPRRITLERGTTVRVYARKVNVTSGKLRWRLQPGAGYLSDTQGVAVNYTAGQKTGVYSLIVEDRADPGISFTIPINVVEEPKLRRGGSAGPGRRLAPLPYEFRLGERVYTLRSTATPYSPVMVDAVEGREATTLYLNTAHPLYREAREAGELPAMLYITSEVVTKHAFLECPGDAPAMELLRATTLSSIFAD